MTENIVWRVLPWRKDDAYTNMAIDKTIAESVAASGPATIRFYKWAGNGGVSFGASQAITDFDTEFCDKNNIQYVKRFTSGRAMYHGPDDFTYAIAAPLSLYPNRYAVTSHATKKIINFLNAVGVQDIRDAGLASLLAGDRKISGSAVCYEQKNTIFIHGSVFCTIDYFLLARIFGEPADKIHSRTTSLLEETEIGKEHLTVYEQEFQHAVLDGLSFEMGELTEQEKEKVVELQQRYAAADWMQSGKKSLKSCMTTWGPRLPKIIKKMLD